MPWGTISKLGSAQQSCCRYLQEWVAHRRLSLLGHLVQEEPALLILGIKLAP